VPGCFYFLRSASQRECRGAYSLDGKMIDMPLLKNAQKVLDRAKAAGKL
jgi:citrate lyase beta subunit